MEMCLGNVSKYVLVICHSSVMGGGGIGIGGGG